MTGFRAWCFTAWEWYTEEMWKELPWGIRYIVWALEWAPEQTDGEEFLNGYHIQGYFQTYEEVGLKAAKRMMRFLDGVHLAPARCSDVTNRAYVSKDPILGPWILGEPTKQGDRSDLKRWCSMISSGATDQELIQADPVAYLRFGNRLGAFRENMNPIGLRDTINVFFIHGPTGTGKTYIPYTLHKDQLYDAYHDKHGLRFGGYHQEKYLLIDEFDGDISLKVMLKMLDRYCPKTDQKYGELFVPRWTVVYIITNYPPHMIYPDEYGARRDAFWRRVTKIYELKERSGQDEIINDIKKILG